MKNGIFFGATNLCSYKRLKQLYFTFLLRILQKIILLTVVLKFWAVEELQAKNWSWLQVFDNWEHDIAWEGKIVVEIVELKYIFISLDFSLKFLDFTGLRLSKGVVCYMN